MVAASRTVFAYATRSEVTAQYGHAVGTFASPLPKGSGSMAEAKGDVLALSAFRWAQCACG